MPDRFTLHARLAADSVALGDGPLCRLQLMNDGRFPWLLLVPRHPDLREIHDLPPPERALLIEEIARASSLMQQVLQGRQDECGRAGQPGATASCPCHRPLRG